MTRALELPVCGTRSLEEAIVTRGGVSVREIDPSTMQSRLAVSYTHLLEADVNYLVVKDFCKRVTERCVGQQVLDSLSPAQQVIKIVNEEMTALMGTENARLTWSSSVPTIYMPVSYTHLDVYKRQLLLCGAGLVVYRRMSGREKGGKKHAPSYDRG